VAAALDIIKGAMRLVNALEAGAAPSGEDGDDALTALNDLLEQWSLERLTVFQVLNEQFTWASGQASQTIGSGGDFATTRPTRLEEGCFARDAAGFDWPLKILDSQGYQEIPLKSQGATVPGWIYYSPEMPLGKLYIYPVPAGAITVNLASLKRFSAFPDPATAVVLPLGYVRALKYNLAVAMAPEWIQRDASATVQSIAVESKAAIMRTNTTRPIMPRDKALRPRFRGGYNIQSDGYR
jgi:hypothetical protein